MEHTHGDGQGLRPTLLIVEDHALVRTSLREWLMGVFPGCHFLEARSGEEAMTLLNFQPPDIILMDIGLPGMNGLEATRRIKQLLPQVKVVILTLHDNTEYRAEAGAAKANAYVLKQTMSTELVPLLKSLLPGRP
jgi:DNA-binding NarL/FixJ family response regulator